MPKRFINRHKFDITVTFRDGKTHKPLKLDLQGACNPGNRYNTFSYCFPVSAQHSQEAIRTLRESLMLQDPEVIVGNGNMRDSERPLGPRLSEVMGYIRIEGISRRECKYSEFNVPIF